MEKPPSSREKRERIARRLAELLERAEKGGFRALTARDTADLGTHYRAVTTHLAQARTAGVSTRKTKELNALAARAHAVIYGQGRRRSTWSSLGRSLLAMPAAVRALWPFHLVAFLFFVAGGAYGYSRTVSDPEFALTVMPAEETRTPFATREQLEKPILAGRQGEVNAAQKTVFTAFLWQNNTRVAIMSFFSGFLAGLPPAFAMFHNGVLIGAMTVPYHDHGLARGWWAWLLPHGVTEILALVLLGGGGLAIGYTVIAPGRRSRVDALLDLRTRIFPLLVLVFPMLFAAALIESFLRQSALGDGARYAFAAGSAIFWIAVLGFAPAPKRKQRPRPIAETRFPIPTEEEILA